MNLTVQLSAVGVEDIDGILDIETASFAQPWGRLTILDELMVSDAVRLGARTPSPQADAALIGFLFARVLDDEMHLMKLAVDPQWRMRGAASALLRAALAEARRRRAVSIVVEVRSTNRGAIGFYRKAGFKTIGVRPNYYPQTGENALVMSKPLKEAS